MPDPVDHVDHADRIDPIPFPTSSRDSVVILHRGQWYRLNGRLALEVIAALPESSPDTQPAQSPLQFPGHLARSATL